MRLALLGVDDQMLHVAAAAVRTGRHQIAMIDALSPRVKEAAALAPNARLVDNADAMLDNQSVDAVLVSADHPSTRVDQLRRLIQVGMPVLVSHPISLSMLDCYELDMIRAETRSLVLAYLPARWHPAAVQLGGLIDGATASPIGPVEQIVCERFLADRRRDMVLKQFARDADLLQFLASDATKLHALGSSKAAAGINPYTNLSVQLTTAEGLVARWSVSPIESDSGARLTFVGSEGKAILWMPDSEEPWQLEFRTPKETSTTDYPNWDAPAEAMENFSLALEHNETDSNWPEAARTIELAETIDRSLAKGRTIDLHNEQFSEVGTFKGMMASVGCALLMVGLMMVLVVAIVRAIAVQAGWNWLAGKLDAWPYLLLAVCAVY
ncbi:MAG TPA: Gfo/Idh/MocA family oxidoreductase, partial [Pirellulales bacterium]